MGKRYHTSKLYRSVRTMPTPEDTTSRQYPMADIWNARMQRSGLAAIGMYFNGEEYETYFNLIEPCGEITHWRWAENQ